MSECLRDHWILGLWLFNSGVAFLVASASALVVTRHFISQDTESEILG